MKYFIHLLSICCLFLSCTTTTMETKKIDIQGHRGCRGLMPENTIAGFIKALELGVNTLEMDVVITKDKEVLVSHEPWISSTICKAENGDTLPDETGKSINIYQMNYSEIMRYDCGSLQHPNFPEQQNRKAAKPLLNNVINTIETLVKEENYTPVKYNIEIKSNNLGDGIYHPKPEEFVDLVYEVLKSENVIEKTIIQSFDPRPLNYLNDKDSTIKIALLVDNQLGYAHNLQRLDFKPNIFSPDRAYVTESMISFFHNEGIEVIPWTVNDTTQMKQFIDLGVDGIITDYPDKLIQLIKKEAS